jgi:putative membrane protein insertion efficiency factor
LSLPIWLYRYGVSPFVAPRCRFMPTCSEYALEALACHGPMAGAWLALRRLVRCHPWGAFGYDPVPPRADHENQRIGGTREPDGGKASLGFAPPQPRISASR